MSSRRIYAMTIASMKMIVRDRTALFFSLLFPIVFMTLFGLIFGNAGSSRPDLDVVGTGPLVSALEQSKAVKVHVQPDARTAIRRVHDGDETGALVLSGRLGAAVLPGIVDRRGPGAAADRAGRGQLR